MSTVRESTRSPVPIKAGPAAERSFGRAANWTVGTAAAILVLISVGGYFYHREQLLAIAAEHLRLIVTGPSNLQAGVAAEYTVSTTAISGQPLPAQVEVAILGPDGNRLKAYKEPANEHGRLQVVIPADLQLPSQTRLRVVALHGESREETEMPLRVEPVRYATQLALDKPQYQPGETVRYRSLTLSRFALTADCIMPIHFEILAPNRAVVPKSSWDVVTDRGVASGAFTIPDDLAAGQYTLVVRSPNEMFPRQERPFFVQLPGLNKGSETVVEIPTKTKSIEPSQVNVTFYPEGGYLAAELENRVYFVAQDSLGKPIRLSGMIVAKSHSDSGHDTDIATVQTAEEGMGAFSLTPRAGEAYRLKITSPTGVKDEPKLPAVAADRDDVLTTGAGVFAAEKPLEFNIRASKAGLPLVVAAYCRDVQVGQQPLASKIGANPVAISLDSALGGVVQLAVYDYSTSPPTLAADRLVYRPPGRQLNVRIAGTKTHYAPGEKADLTLSVTNEKGQPVPAVLGVAVVDEALSIHTPAMSTRFLLTDEVGKPETLENADLYLSNESKGKAPAAGALDLLLGVYAARAGAGEPPLMFDNINQIRSNYNKSLADYQADRTKALNTLTTVSFFGGLGLVLLVAMLGLMRIVSGMHLWIPAIGATTCCLIIGAILMDPGRLTNGYDAAVAFSSYHAPTPTPRQSPDRESARPENKPAADASIRLAPKAESHVRSVYWNPLLIAGADGKASISFKLPDAPTTLRVMVDAHGDERIGAGQVEIVTHRTP